MRTLLKPGTELTVGDIIDCWGELHQVRAIVEKRTHLTDAGIHPPTLVAVDGDWEMPIPTGLVSCVTKEAGL
ncbi:hypothetical protein AB0B94_31040 [Micromonospora sp. NPDC048986]|uniref:hypothetical protein n=1 Tax=Micromonospora sp. NPDC048986 TaxID=3155644 RepID=UPI0033CEAED0